MHSAVSVLGKRPVSSWKAGLTHCAIEPKNNNQSYDRRRDDYEQASPFQRMVRGHGPISRSKFASGAIASISSCFAFAWTPISILFDWVELLRAHHSGQQVLQIDQRIERFDFLGLRSPDAA